MAEQKVTPVKHRACCHRKPWELISRFLWNHLRRCSAPIIAQTYTSVAHNHTRSHTQSHTITHIATQSHTVTHIAAQSHTVTHNGTQSNTVEHNATHRHTQCYSVTQSQTQWNTMTHTWVTVYSTLNDVHVSILRWVKGIVFAGYSIHHMSGYGYSLYTTPSHATISHHFSLQNAVTHDNKITQHNTWHTITL